MACELVLFCHSLRTSRGAVQGLTAVGPIRTAHQEGAERCVRANQHTPMPAQRLCRIAHMQRAAKCIYHPAVVKQWRTSPIDEVAVKHWDDYTEVRDEMLSRTSSPLSPWIVVRADDKDLAHLNVIRDILKRLECPLTDKHLAVPDLSVVFPYDQALARVGLLAK